MERQTEGYILRPIRRLNVVLDLEDPFTPELTLEEFVSRFHETPHQPRYRVISVETVSCAEDHQPVLVSECGNCANFVRRFHESICCRRNIPVKL